eukprot:UN32022
MGELDFHDEYCAQYALKEGITTNCDVVFNAPFAHCCACGRYGDYNYIAVTNMPNQVQLAECEGTTVIADFPGSNAATNTLETCAQACFDDGTCKGFLLGKDIIVGGVNELGRCILSSTYICGAA